jgi:hypothetical protein
LKQKKIETQNISFEKGIDEMESKRHTEKARTANRRLAQWRLKCFYETFVQGSMAVIPSNFCAKNQPHRQALFVGGQAAHWSGFAILTIEPKGF